MDTFTCEHFIEKDMLSLVASVWRVMSHTCFSPEIRVTVDQKAYNTDEVIINMKSYPDLIFVQVFLNLLKFLLILSNLTGLPTRRELPTY